MPIDYSGASPKLPDTESLLRSALKFGHMRMIVALEDQGRVSAAAQVLNISQPAASRMIAEMEAMLEVKLCERLPRGIALTPYGRALARRARTILLEMSEADREIADLKSGKGGSVFVGAVTAPAMDLAMRAIREVRRRYPRMEITIQNETSNVLARELLASRHDFIIARIPEDLNPRLFESRVLGIERACLIVRRGHPLLRREPVAFERLTGYDWVLQPGGSLLRRTLESLFIARSVPLPDRVINTSSLLLTIVMVAQSDAIAPVATEVATFFGAEGGLAGAVEILPVEAEIEVQPYSMIKVRNRALSPAAQLLHDFIIERAEDGPADGS
ncbi:LysR family transcriptional regulator [Mesorhizobium sp. 1B3]|uniref:LysR family transcriptional regulator n=1 Tax=Mesorhizobium sp. 1B3 TaxID=3243599 RepID=UPI003D993EB9